MYDKAYSWYIISLVRVSKSSENKKYRRKYQRQNRIGYSQDWSEARMGIWSVSGVVLSVFS